MSITILLDSLANQECFPSDLALGDLKIFIEDLVVCFDQCVERKETYIGGPEQSGSVAVFIPLLLHKFFDLSKFSLATTLNNRKSDQEYLSAQQNVELRKEIYSRYPVLQKKVTIAAQNWRQNTVNILCRWQSDKSEIAQVIFGLTAADKKLGNIVDLGSAYGDEHENGQQSLILALSCGRKIAYKPRCLSLEQNFYRFAGQLGFSELYQPKYISKEQYGWMEYIPQLECENKAQVSNYYYQAGLLLSLLYALEAEDIHHANVIAYGSQPVLIDLETLFHHRDDSTKSIDNQNSCLSLGNHTVLKTHFIPQYLSLASEQELAAIFPVYGDNTPENNSTPRLNAKPIAVNNYVDEFIDGFTAGYLRLMNNKPLLTSPDGPLKIFDGCSARYVCRTTQTYARLIQAACHPNYLLDSAGEQAICDKLNIDVEARQFLGTLLDSEKRSLLRAEIPRFTHRVDHKALYSNGETFDHEFFNLSGIELCQAKIRNMDQSDLAGQVRLIKHSFGLVNSHQVARNPKIELNSKANFQALCETTALSIAQFITQEAIPHQNSKIWTLFKNDAQGRACLDPTNSSLFDGYLGILLFLAHLQNRFPDFSPLELQMRHTQMLVEQAINNDKTNQRGVGFSGLGGLLYGLSQFKKLWPQEQWIAPLGQKVLNLLCGMAGSDKQLDIIGGSAGAILALLSYFKMSGEKQALSIANSFAENLLRHFQTKGHLGWQTDNGNVLAGFAHGNAGIAYALIQLSTVSDKPQLVDCATAAMKFESDLYNSAIDNWPDRRFDSEQEQKEQAMTAWCHAAVGIGMSRLHLKSKRNSVLPDFVETDIKRALAHLSKRSIINNDGLCHGNFGNFELLCLAKEHGMLNVEETQHAEALITQRVHFISKNGLGMMGLTGFTPVSLMNGWAGIGMQLLRFAQPANTPSILLLDC
ncbi:MAG: lantibiotic modifying enzyme [Paraglaciecola sp.]|jgi:lantibiotic modifying enzyme